MRDDRPVDKSINVALQVLAIKGNWMDKCETCSNVGFKISTTRTAELDTSST